MKKTVIATLLLGLGVAAPASADKLEFKHRFTEYADVISVEPVFRQVRYEEPRRECWVEQEEHVVTREGTSRHFDTRRSTQSLGGADALVGGIIGGVIGNQLGRNGSRGARNGATIAGAIVGSAIANEVTSSDVRRHRRAQRSVERQPRRVVTTRPVEKCRETMHTSYENRVSAYDVTYEYRGRTFTTRMKRDPGDRIELQVNVKPARH